MNKLFLKKNKKILAIILCMITILSVILPIIIQSKTYAWSNEEGTIASSENGGHYVGNDGAYYYPPNPMTVLVYRADGSTYIKTYNTTYPRSKFILINNGVRREMFCLEAGINFEDSYNGYTSTNGANSAFFQNLSYTAQYGIMTTLVYGWRDDLPNELIGSCNMDDFRIAAQMIIWEYQQNLRTSPTTINGYDVIPWNIYYNIIANRPAEIAYQWLLRQMGQHTTIPSFSSVNRIGATIHTMKYDVNTGKYSITLTDTNNTLTDLKFEDNSNISVSRSGNNYTFTSNSMITDAITISAQKDINRTNEKMLIWGRPRIPNNG